MALKINPNSERPRKKQGTRTKVILRKKGGTQERILCDSIPKEVTALRRIWYLKRHLFQQMVLEQLHIHMQKKKK